MGKKLVKIISAIVTAIMLLCFCACSGGKNKSKEPPSVTVTESELIGNTIDTMLRESGFTVEMSGARDGLLAAKKTTQGYDYVYSQDTHPLAVKFGDKIFTRATDEKGAYYKSAFTGTDNLPVGVTPEGVVTLIKQRLTALDGSVTSKDGVFIFEYSDTFADKITAALRFVTDGKNEPAGEYIAASLGGENYTADMLSADVKAVFADRISLAAMARAVDAFLSHIGSSRTAKSVADDLCTLISLTAADVHALFPISGTPKSGDTAYDYIMSSMLAITPVDNFLSRLGGGLTTRSIRNALVAVIEGDETFDEFYDRAVAPRLYEAFRAYTSGVNVFTADNLAKWQVASARLDLRAEIGEDYRVRKLEVTPDVCINYEGVCTPLVIIDGKREYAFSYGAVEVSLPAGAIAPCLNLSGNAAGSLPDAGGTKIAVYDGNFTYESIKLICGAEEIAGVERDGNYVKLSADAVNEIRTRMNEDSEVTLELTYTDSRGGKFSLRADFSPASSGTDEDGSETGYEDVEITP